jgi:hypothetical protein
MTTSPGARDLFPERRAEVSALDKEAGGLQREHLIRGAEVRRLEMCDYRKWRIEDPAQDDGNNQWNEEVPMFGTLATRIAGYLLIAGDRHMQMTTTLVFRVQRRTKRPMLVASATLTGNRIGASIGVAVVARFRL